MGIDPVGVDENNVHSHNRYAYANNNPYKFVDPDGRASTLALCFGGPAACAVGIVTAGATAIYVNNVLQHAIQQNRTDKGEDISSALTGTSATASPGGMLPEGDDQNGNNSSDRSNVRFQKDKGAGQGDISADISKRDFMKNLENDGFKKSISKDGTAKNFTRGNTRYSVRDFSKSGDGGPAAEKYINDKIITKIRLGK